MKPANGTPQPITLSRHIGASIRVLRESRGLRQDDLAGLARPWGMDWGQATVAAIELGRRQLGIEELALLTKVLDVELANIFGDSGSVRLTPAVEVDATALSEIFSGRARRTSIWPDLRADPVAAQNAAIANHLWPAHHHQDPRSSEYQANVGILKAAHVDALSDAECKAARRLRTFPLAIAATARKLWGQSFTEERDRRVAKEASTDATPRTLQALRGHVTRRMLEDLEKEGIARLKPARLGRKKGAPNAR